MSVILVTFPGAPEYSEEAIKKVSPSLITISVLNFAFLVVYIVVTLS